MTRKHFEAEAARISRLPICDGIDAAKRFIPIALRANPRFDVARFVRACGIGGRIAANLVSNWS